MLADFINATIDDSTDGRPKGATSQVELTRTCAALNPGAHHDFYGPERSTISRCHHGRHQDYWTDSPSVRNAVLFLAITANAIPEDRERCLTAGMNDDLATPV